MKRKISISCLLLITWLLAGCGKANDYQQFRVVHTNSLFENYIEEVQDQPDSDALEVYKREVIETIYEDCFQDGEYLYIADNLLNEAPTNLAELKAVSEAIEEKKEKLNANIEEALSKSKQLLPTQQDVAVCVFPAVDSTVAGYAVGAGKIIIPYNESFTDDDLKTTIAHEYHHSIYAEKDLQEGVDTILDNLVFEGKAVMFERLVYPDLSSTPVDMDYDKNSWAKIEKDLDSTNFNRSLEILEGGNDLPPLYGYSEGYKMVKSYLDLHPDVSAEQWTVLDSQEIIDQGKYFEHYQ